MEVSRVHFKVDVIYSFERSRLRSKTDRYEDTRIGSGTWAVSEVMPRGSLFHNITFFQFFMLLHKIIIRWITSEKEEPPSVLPQNVDLNLFLHLMLLSKDNLRITFQFCSSRSLIEGLVSAPTRLLIKKRHAPPRTWPALFSIVTELLWPEPQCSSKCRIALNEKVYSYFFLSCL